MQGDGHLSVEIDQLVGGVGLEPAEGHQPGRAGPGAVEQGEVTPGGVVGDVSGTAGVGGRGTGGVQPAGQVGDLLGAGVVADREGQREQGGEVAGCRVVVEGAAQFEAGAVMRMSIGDPCSGVNGVAVVVAFGLASAVAS